MSSITFNGKTVVVPSGASIAINNNNLYVNGKLWADEKLNGTVKLIVEGSLSSLKVEYGDVEMNGNVEGNVSAGGSVRCGDVQGKVTANGSANCGNVSGNVSAGGSINCGTIGGNADAVGSINYRMK